MKNVTLGKLQDGKPLLLDLHRLIHMSVMASSGGGKTYALLKLLEATRGHLPQCVIDPEGDFTPLRRNKNYDYVLASPKGGDIVAHPSTAKVLATHFIEQNFNLLIDLYEMDLSDQRRFVRLFCEGLLEAPRNFWRPRLIVVDEFQEFAPEKGGDSAESLPALIRVSKKGRKRGLRLVGATQRAADVSKSLTSQMGNKLVGVQYTDIDLDRAAKELRMRDQAKADTLGKLEPGQFYAVGIALGHDLKLAMMDMPKDRPDEGGKSAFKKPPAPGPKLRAILAGLATLPKEALEEAKTKEELQARVKDLTRQLAIASKTTHAMGAMVSVASEGELKKIREDAQKQVSKATVELDRRRINLIKKAMVEMQEGFIKVSNEIYKKHSEPSPVIAEPIQIKQTPPPIAPLPLPPNTQKNFANAIVINPDKKFGKADRAIVGFLMITPSRKWSRAQIGCGSGYSTNSSTFDNALSRLRVANIIEGSDQIGLKPGWQNEELGAVELNGNNSEAWKRNLGARARLFWDHLYAHPNTAYSKDALCEATNCQPNSSTTDNALSNLNVLKVILKENGLIKLNPEMMEV